MKHLKFFAALCCVAAVFAACEKNDPSDNTNNNGTNTDQYFYVTVVSNDETRGTVKGEGNYPAGAKINIIATPNTGSYFQQWNDGNTDNPRTITVTGDATYTAIFAANDNPGQKFNVTVVSLDDAMGTVTGSGQYPAGSEIVITATANEGYSFQKWHDGNTDNPRTITVTADITYTAIFAANPNGNESGHEYVELGLSVKWATCNVGATKPEEYGNYYAWGETETKTTYNWSTYTWCRGSGDTQTKYCTDRYYGTVDNKTELELADDAARANWGGAWRMPTDAEWTELRENCTWTSTSDYNGTGVAGRIVTSNINGNSIFLPAAGSGGQFGGAGFYGYYWSSSLDTDDPYDAWRVSFFSEDASRDDYYRCDGLSVRPVCK